MMSRLFAHGGEKAYPMMNGLHTSNNYDDLWFLLVVLAVTGLSVWLFTKRKTPTVLLLSVILLFMGIYINNSSPVVSILAISFGLLAIFFSFLYSLGEMELGSKIPPEKTIKKQKTKQK